MGYSERHCQLCGVSFNVSRIRTADEPTESAWDRTGTGVMEDYGCDAKDCSSIWRTLPTYVHHDISVRESREICEHIAGPDCAAPAGYSGYRISAEEMKESTWCKCLMTKTKDWSPEPSDEAFELEASHTWVTGTSRGPPDEFEIYSLLPQRHGISKTGISNCREPDVSYGTPMHPWCFEIFKHASLKHFQKVHIDGLRALWLANADLVQRFPDFQESLDVDLVNEQFYSCVPGTEYLVAHPIRVLGLPELIHTCVYENQVVSEVVFTSRANKSPNWDPFATLSPELKLMILLELQRRDVANLRLTSRSFEQLPQSYFRQVVLSEMPWMLMDIESLPPKQVDWHQLWCSLCAADGGLQADEIERDWLEHSKQPNLYWDKLYIGLTPDEREAFGTLSLGQSQRKITDEQMEKMKAVVETRKKSGRQWPKSTELKGLRNRRRIYGDVQEILQRIEGLQEKVW